MHGHMTSDPSENSASSVLPDCLRDSLVMGQDLLQVSVSSGVCRSACMINQAKEGNTRADILLKCLNPAKLVLHGQQYLIDWLGLHETMLAFPL